MIDYNDIIIVSLEERRKELWFKHQNKSIPFKYFGCVSVEYSYIWATAQKLQYNNSTWYLIVSHTVHFVYAACVGVELNLILRWFSLKPKSKLTFKIWINLLGRKKVYKKAGWDHEKIIQFLHVLNFSDN